MTSQKATNIARRMVMEYGMSDQLGPMRYGKSGGEVFLGRDYNRQADYSDQLAADIDDEVRRLIRVAHSEARQILAAHRPALNRMVTAPAGGGDAGARGNREGLPRRSQVASHRHTRDAPPSTPGDPGG